jgi:hypothetical protein
MKKLKLLLLTQEIVMSGNLGYKSIYQLSRSEIERALAFAKFEFCLIGVDCESEASLLMEQS